MTNTDIDILAQNIVQVLCEDNRALQRISRCIADAITESNNTKLPDKISKNMAYKHFGRKYVDEWVRFGLITVEERGNRLLLETKRLRELDRIYQIPNLYEKEKNKYAERLIAR